MYESLLDAFYSNKLHAAFFIYRGVRYGFAGWWVLWWGDGDDDSKLYETMNDFLQDPFFDGKTFIEIQDELTDIDWEFDPI